MTRPASLAVNSMSPKSVAVRKQGPVGAEAVKANGSGTSRTMAAAEKGEKKVEKQTEKRAHQGGCEPFIAS